MSRAQLAALAASAQKSGVASQPDPSGIFPEIFYDQRKASFVFSGDAFSRFFRVSGNFIKRDKTARSRIISGRELRDGRCRVIKIPECVSLASIMLLVIKYLLEFFPSTCILYVFIYLALLCTILFDIDNFLKIQ